MCYFTYDDTNLSKVAIIIYICKVIIVRKCRDEAIMLVNLQRLLASYIPLIEQFP